MSVSVLWDTTGLRGPIRSRGLRRMRATCQRIGIGRKVVVPACAFADIAGRELPVLVRFIEARSKRDGKHRRCSSFAIR